MLCEETGASHVEMALRLPLASPDALVQQVAAALPPSAKLAIFDAVRQRVEGAAGVWAQLTRLAPTKLDRAGLHSSTCSLACGPLLHGLLPRPAAIAQPRCPEELQAPPGPRLPCPRLPDMPSKTAVLLLTTCAAQVTSNTAILLPLRQLVELCHARGCEVCQAPPWLQLHALLLACRCASWPILATHAWAGWRGWKPPRPRPVEPRALEAARHSLSRRRGKAEGSCKD